MLRSGRPEGEACETGDDDCERYTSLGGLEAVHVLADGISARWSTEVVQTMTQALPVAQATLECQTSPAVYHHRFRITNYYYYDDKSAFRSDKRGCEDFSIKIYILFAVYTKECTAKSAATKPIN